MRMRAVGVLKFAAISNNVHVECISTHPRRSGGGGNRHVSFGIWFPGAEGMGEMEILLPPWLFKVRHAQNEGSRPIYGRFDRFVRVH